MSDNEKNQKIKQPLWVTAVACVLGFAIIQIFRFAALPYWVGLVLGIGTAFLVSVIWRIYVQRAVNVVANQVEKNIANIDWNDALTKNAINPSNEGRLFGYIEAVKIDSRYYYYAYNASSDAEISPIFADVRDMADFAEDTLYDSEGVHEKEYWITNIKSSQKESPIFGSVPELNSSELRVLWESLRSARQTGAMQPSIKLNDFVVDVLLNLEREASEFDIEEYLDESMLDINRSDSEIIEELIEFISGRNHGVKDLGIEDAAKACLLYLDALSEQVDETWRRVLKGEPL